VAVKTKQFKATIVATSATGGANPHLGFWTIKIDGDDAPSSKIQLRSRQCAGFSDGRYTPAIGDTGTVEYACYASSGTYQFTVNDFASRRFPHERI
jgi:hypothetical protein